MRLREERGQTSAEYLGVLVLISLLAVVLAVGALGIGIQVGDGIQTLICQILGDGCTVDAGAAEGEGGDSGGGILGWLGDAAGWVGDRAGDVGGWLLDQGGQLLSGGWDTLKGMAGFLWSLLPFHSGWTDAWKDLGAGLWHLATNPLELLKAIVGWDVLKEKGFSYWLGGMLVTLGLGFGIGRVLKVLRGGRLAAGATGARGGIAVLTRYGDRLIRRWTPNDPPGPLSGNQAWVNSFRSATYNEVELLQPTTLYRVYSDPARQLGPFWSRTQPTGPTQAILDNALDPRWGNQATSVVEIQVPPGTIVYEGAVAPQAGLVGGGEQVLIPRVDPSWVVRSWDFPPAPPPSP